MRSVYFVKCLEFESLSNVYKSAIALGDVDNDGNQELVVGNMDGDLYIYKERKKIQEINGLGMITAVGVGDILNCGSNALVVVCGNGWCHIFLCLSRNADDNQEELPVKLEPVHIQRIPANTKVSIMGDIDNDGNIELVLGLTDRVVRCYRWTQNISGGKLVCLNKWECADQIGNITLNYDKNGQPCLLISQPGGTFMRIRCQTDEEKNSDKMIVDYQPLTSRIMRNPGISSEIIGNIVTSDQNKEKGSPYTVATLDGTLMFVHDEEIQWSIQVHHQLSALSKMDVTGNGSDEIITCSWEGHTYILDQERNSIQFQMEEPVSGFCAGMYTINDGQPPSPCLVYLTFSNKLHVYYNIHFPSIVTKNLLQHLIEDTETDTLCLEVTKSADESTKKRLITWSLYGHHNFR